jgi:hypothetical protein
MVPRETLLRPVGFVLAGWIVVLGAGLGIGAWSAPHSGR